MAETACSEVILRRPRGSVKRSVILLITVLILLFGMFIAINELLTAPIAAAAEEEVKRSASAVLNGALAEISGEYAENGEVRTFTSESTTNDGVGLLYIDSAKLAQFAGKITLRAQDRLLELDKLDISVPMGTLSGFVLLNGSGPDITAKVTPLGAVTSGFSSEFISAGVNQTLYRAMLTLKAELSILISGRERVVTVSVTSPILETIVIGKTPQAYTDVSSLDDALNLIPTEAD